MAKIRFLNLYFIFLLKIAVAMKLKPENKLWVGG